MKHEGTWKLLNDYVDADLSSEQMIDLEAHIDTCRDCRREVEGLRDLTGNAASLTPTIEPSTDLWPTIAFAIENEAASRKFETAGEDNRDRSQRRTRSLHIARWLRSAFGFPEARGIPTFVGAALIAVIIFVILEPWKPPTPENLVKIENTFVERGLPTVTHATFQALQAECRQADLELEHFATREGNSRLYPVLDQMNQDLRMINQSITQISEAWKANPDNPHLTRLLVWSYQTKISLQERMVEVSVIS